MTPTIAGIAVAAILLSASMDPSAPTVAAGARVESDSDTAPREVARCIAYNIGRKMPGLQLRSRAGEVPGEDGYLILTALDPAPTTFGVIRIAASETGSRLTTWLPERSLSAPPEELARRLVAGC